MQTHITFSYISEGIEIIFFFYNLKEKVSRMSVSVCLESAYVQTFS